MFIDTKEDLPHFSPFYVDIDLRAAIRPRHYVYGWRRAQTPIQHKSSHIFIVCIVH